MGDKTDKWQRKKKPVILWWNISDGHGLSQDDSAPTRRQWEFTELFDEDGNDVNLILWPTQSPDLSPTVHRWEILEWRIKHQLREYLLEEWCTVRFQIHVESMPWSLLQWHWWPNRHVLICHHSVFQKWSMVMCVNLAGGLVIAPTMDDSM